jgi:hypothetical protein
VTGVIGVPLICPEVVFKISPGGSVPPPVSSHLNGAVPPSVWTVCEYGGNAR